ncbi:MAG: paraquat-inducible protein A [Pseudomonadota bacterium]
MRIETLTDAGIAINSRYIACLSCDLLLPRPELRLGELARCPRCGSVVLTNKPESAERTVALLSASAIAYLLMAFYPFLEVSSSGLVNKISVADSIGVLWRTGYHLLAVFCLLLILVVPMLRLLLTVVVAAHLLHHQQISLRLRRVFSTALRAAPWAMTDVFVLGVVVSLVKIGQLADIQLGIAFWALLAFTVFTALGAGAMCADTLWQRARLPA